MGTYMGNKPMCAMEDRHMCVLMENGIMCALMGDRPMGTLMEYGAMVPCMQAISMVTLMVNGRKAYECINETILWVQ